MPLPRHVDRHRAIRSPEAIAHSRARNCPQICLDWSLLRRLQAIVHMLHDDLAEDFARMDIFQPDIGVDCGLHVAVAEKSSDELVLAWAGLENESACGVPELIPSHSHPGLLINPFLT